MARPIYDAATFRVSDVEKIRASPLIELSKERERKKNSFSK